MHGSTAWDKLEWDSASPITRRLQKCCFKAPWLSFSKERGGKSAWPEVTLGVCRGAWETEAGSLSNLESIPQALIYYLEIWKMQVSLITNKSHLCVMVSMDSFLATQQSQPRLKPAART